MMSKGDEIGMYKSSENETFDGYNIPVALAAKIMGKDQQYIRQGLVQGILPIGTAFKREGSKHYDYYISPKKINISLILLVFYLHGIKSNIL